ncbi:transposase IS200-family protein, partial [mine drainage metagenome]
SGLCKIHMPISRAAHKVYEIRYHFVICVKYRKRMLLEEDKISYFKYILQEIEKRYDIRFDTIGTDGNHAHLFIDAAPKYFPSKIFMIVKSIAARELFNRFPDIKTDLWGGQFWNDGGYIGTVAEGRTADTVRKYIQKQGSKEEKDDYKQLKLFKVH